MGWFRQEQGQSGTEYLLVVGAVVVAMDIALQTFTPDIVHAVEGLLCPSVDTAVPAATVGSCLGP